MSEFHSSKHIASRCTTGRHSLYTSKPASAATSLITLTLPAFNNVRPCFYPAAQTITAQQVRFMAEVLLAVNSDCRMSWPAGTSSEDIAVNILRRIEKELNFFEKKQGISTGKISVYANEKNGLIVTVNVVDDIMPIFYEDIDMVKKKAPELLPLFYEALRLFVAVNASISAEDVKWMGRDLYEDCILPDAESYDEEEFEKEKKFYGRLLDSGPDGPFFDVTKKTFKKRYTAFKGAVAGLKVMNGSGYKEVCKKWLMKVVSCLDMNFNTIRQTLDCAGDCLSFEYAFPILWERGDAITETFDRHVNETYESGIEVIPTVSFDLPWGMDVKPDIRKLKGVIRTLAVMRDVFSFFEKGRKNSNGQDTIEV